MKPMRSIPFLALSAALVACASGPNAPTYPAPTSGNAQLNGRILFHGQSPGNALPLSLEQQVNGADQLTATTTTTNTDGFFSFNNLAPGTYRVFYTPGSTVFDSATINTVGYYHSPYFTVAANQVLSATPSVDLFWLAAPKPGPNATQSLGTNPMTFSFQPKFGGTYLYSVAVANGAGSPFFRSASATDSTQLTWNYVGNQGAFANQAFTPNQTLQYQVQFTDAQGGYGGTSTLSIQVVP